MSRWILLFAVIAAAQAEEAIVKEGSYWVRVESGVLPLPPMGKIKVVSQGKVHTQGEARRNVAYVLKRRVRARDAATAQAMLAFGGVRLTQRGEWSYLVVLPAPSGMPAPEIELRLPRVLQQVSFQVDDGAITAYDLDAPVLVDAQSGSVQMDRIAGAVTARTGGGEIRLGQIRGAIRCVSGGGGISVEGAESESVLETAGGEVFVRQANGPVVANTGGGNIRIMNALSTVNAHTNGGLVEVNHAAGMVSAITTAGSIHVGQAAGARCESAAGAIHLGAVSGAVHAATLRGSISAGIFGNRMENSFLNTSSGDITVFLPSKLAVTVQAESETAGRIGTIQSDFPEVRILSALFGGRPIQAEGSLNGGGPLLRLSASGGVIYLRRQK